MTTGKLNGWRTDLDQVPVDTPYLVFLTEEGSGSRVHVAKKMKIVNGFLEMVGGHFSYDMPPVMLWHPMIKLPQPGEKS